MTRYWKWKLTKQIFFMNKIYQNQNFKLTRNPNVRQHLRHIIQDEKRPKLITPRRSNKAWPPPHCTCTIMRSSSTSTQLFPPPIAMANRARLAPSRLAKRPALAVETTRYGLFSVKRMPKAAGGHFTLVCALYNAICSDATYRSPRDARFSYVSTFVVNFLLIGARIGSELIRRYSRG